MLPQEKKQVVSPYVHGLRLVTKVSITCQGARCAPPWIPRLSLAPPSSTRLAALLVRHLVPLALRFGAHSDTPPTVDVAPNTLLHVTRSRQNSDEFCHSLAACRRCESRHQRCCQSHHLVTNSRSRACDERQRSRALIDAVFARHRSDKTAIRHPEFPTSRAAPRLCKVSTQRTKISKTLSIPALKQVVRAMAQPWHADRDAVCRNSSVCPRKEPAHDRRIPHRREP